jgi:hypothetical protein
MLNYTLCGIPLANVRLVWYSFLLFIWVSSTIHTYCSYVTVNQHREELRKRDQKWVPIYSWNCSGMFVYCHVGDCWDCMLSCSDPYLFIVMFRIVETVCVLIVETVCFAVRILPRFWSWSRHYGQCIFDVEFQKHARCVSRARSCGNWCARCKACRGVYNSSIVTI